MGANKIWVEVKFKFKCNKKKLLNIDCAYLQPEIARAMLIAADLQHVDTTDWSITVEPANPPKNDKQTTAATD